MDFGSWKNMRICGERKGCGTDTQGAGGGADTGDRAAQRVTSTSLIHLPDPVRTGGMVRNLSWHLTVLDEARASLTQAGRVINVINARAVVTSKAGLLLRDEGNRMMASSWGKVAWEVGSNDRLGVFYRGGRMRRGGRMGDSGGRKVGWRGLELSREGRDSEGSDETHSRAGVWLEMDSGSQFKRLLERV